MSLPLSPASSPAPSPAAETAREFREIELKLHVPPTSAARLWSSPLVMACAIGRKTVARVDNRYFDTPERELAGQRMALRLRRIGRSWVQTLKTSGDQEGALSARGEWETPVAGPALQLTKLRTTPLVSVASPRSLARRLLPVFTTNFRREAQRLRLVDGCEIELAFDTGWIHAGRGRARRSLPICEVELEVKVAGTGDPATALLRFARRLVRDLPLIPLEASKAARGYRLADKRDVVPARTMLPAPIATDRASVHLARVITACTRALLDNTHALIERSGSPDIDPEFVHQARVAIRRLRSALRTFRSITKGRRFDEVDRSLQALGRVFGCARDWDVFASTTIERLAAKVGSDEQGRAALVELRSTVASRRDEAYRGLATALDQGPFGATMIESMRIARRLESEATDQAGPVLAACVPDWLDDQRDRIVRQSRRIAVLDGDERHGLRVEVKRLRYALDLFVALYDPGAVKTFQDALAELQTRLGRLNDEVVADRLLQSFDASPSRDLVMARHAHWLAQHIVKQLPKVAALSVAFELTREPWSIAPTTRAADGFG